VVHFLVTKMVKFLMIIYSPKTSPNDRPPAFSWVAVHRDLMGDRFYDESKFYASNVHVILGRLDKVIREGGRK